MASRAGSILWGGAAALAVAVALIPGSAMAATSRAWELVTPPDPNGTAVSGVVAVTPDGDRVVYLTVGPLPGAPGGSQASPNLAKRGPSGWDTVPLGFPYSVVAPGFGGAGPALAAGNQDMSGLVWTSTRPLLPGSPESPNAGLYRSGIGGVPTLIGGGASAQVYGASADLGSVVFQTTTQLLPEDVRSSGGQVYESTADGLRLVGVDGAGVPLSACGAMAGANNYQPNVVSRDGRRIFFSSPDSSSCGDTRRVYLRERGAVTREVSASRCTRFGCNTSRTVNFLGATPNGAVAYVATSQQLTNDDVDESQDLYRYDVEDDTLSRVSVGTSGVGASVTGNAVYPSNDGSRVYFIASGTLVPGQGVAGPKIYVADAQGVHYVTTLESSDPLLGNLPLSGAGEVAQMTPSGDRLLFSSARALTPDDTDAQSDAYLYDADDGSLTRVSGSGGTGNGAFAAHFVQDGFGIAALSGQPRRSLTSDGRRVFFWTAEALVAGDVNATTDVYEWEDGELGLITSGKASDSVRYRAASADGRSVFFTTDESLVPADDDGGDPDLYVAREGGGFSTGGGLPPTDCADASCAPAPIQRVDRPVPASVDFNESAAEGQFGALPVSARARRRMAASGVLVLTVATPKAGRVDARALARVGRRVRTVARGHASARRAGTVRLRLPLSQAAVGRLRDGGALKIRVVLRRTHPDRSSVLRLRLDPQR